MTSKFIALVIALTLTACSGGGGGGGSNSNSSSTTPSPPANTPPAGAAELSLHFMQTKEFAFLWTDVSDATFYRLLENPDGLSGFSQVGTDVPPGMEGTMITVPLYKRVSAQYILESCSANGCVSSSTISVTGSLAEAIGYFKASNTGNTDMFGTSVSLSEDGNTLAVGAILEDSNAIGINGNQADNSSNNSGAVYVFSRSGNNMWAQQAYIKASNSEAFDQFGASISLSSDGNTLAVGSSVEASSATGINGNQTDNTANNAGAVYVFTRSGSNWSQQAYIKGSNAEAGDLFGTAISLANNGNTLAVGAIGEASNANGTNGNQADNSAGFSGAVYVFTRSGSTWSQQTYIKASNAGGAFGQAISLSQDGNTLAVGATGEDSNATGINGNQADNSANSSGAVYVFTHNGTNWTQQAYIKSSNTEASDSFGNAISLANDGNTLAIAAVNEDSSSTGVNGNQTDNSANGSGAAYVFSRSGSTWSQQAYIKASNTAVFDEFGTSISLGDNGSILAVGSIAEGGNSIGLNGNQTDNNNGSGAVYVFSRNGSNWSQQAYIKASNTGFAAELGTAVSFGNNGGTLAIGANEERSNATGINGDQTDTSNNASGAVYLY